MKPMLREYSLPYAAMAWLIAHTPSGVFLGNPRVHFQHYADRMNEPRREQRRWRAWACWALARAVRPDLPNDPEHEVTEPSLDAIDAALRTHGSEGEARLWRAEFQRAVAIRAAIAEAAPQVDSAALAPVRAVRHVAAAPRARLVFR